MLNLTEDSRVVELGVNSFWSGLYRRDFLLNEKLFMNETKGAAYQDTTFSFLTAIKAKRAMLSRKAFYCYRLDNPNSSVNNPKRITMLTEEYCLLKKRLEEEGLFEKYRDTLFSWRIRGHLGFYDSLSEKLKKEYVPLMRQDLLIDMLPEGLWEKGLSEKEREVVIRAGGSEEELAEYLEQIYRELEVMYCRLEQIKEKVPIVIFGCGALGKLVYRYLTFTDRKAAAYADNDSRLWGTYMGSVPVLRPEETVRLFPDGVYIIANVEHFKEIQGQLEQYGIHNGNMIVCNDYGFFFKHVLLKRTLRNEDDNAGIL